jgi:hypothetical protein
MRESTDRGERKIKYLRITVGPCLELLLPVPTATMATNFRTGDDETSSLVHFEPVVIEYLKSPVL